MQIRIIRIKVAILTLYGRSPGKPLTFHDFCTGGQLILWASRHWMQAYRRGRTVAPCVWQSFSMPGLVNTYIDLCELLTIVAFREFRAQQFGRPESRGLTDSEIRFMTVLDRLECGDSCAAQQQLDDIAAPAVARAIIAKGRELVESLSLSGYHITHVPSPSGHVPSATLH